MVFEKLFGVRFHAYAQRFQVFLFGLAGGFFIFKAVIIFFVKRKHLFMKESAEFLTGHVFREIYFKIPRSV